MGAKLQIVGNNILCNGQKVGELTLELDTTLRFEVLEAIEANLPVMQRGNIGYTLDKMRVAYDYAKKTATGTPKQRAHHAWRAVLVTVVAIAENKFNPLNPPHRADAVPAKGQ